MKKLVPLLALLALGSAAHASKINCSGQYFGYNFVMTGDVSSNKAVGTIVLTVDDGSGTTQSADFTPTSSDIEAGQYIKVTATGAQGTGTLDAPYNSSAGNYSGNLDANTTDGDFTVPVTCTLN